MPPAQLPPACRPACRRLWLGAACTQPGDGGGGGRQIHRAGAGGWACCRRRGSGGSAPCAVIVLQAVCLLRVPPQIAALWLPCKHPALPPLLPPLLQRFYQKYVEREIVNHRLLAHPHIVGFKEVFVTQKVGPILVGAGGQHGILELSLSLYLSACAVSCSPPVLTCHPLALPLLPALQHLAIVMEYVGGGNLQQFVEAAGRLPEWQARCFFQQLILALQVRAGLCVGLGWVAWARPVGGSLVVHWHARAWTGQHLPCPPPTCPDLCCYTCTAPHWPLPPCPAG